VKFVVDCHINSPTSVNSSVVLGLVVFRFPLPDVRAGWSLMISAILSAEVMDLIGVDGLGFLGETMGVY
jgi:hypothetical protein